MKITDTFMFVVGVILVALLVSMVIGYTATAVNYAIRTMIRKNLGGHDFHLFNLGLLGLLCGSITGLITFFVVFSSFDTPPSSIGSTFLYLGAVIAAIPPFIWWSAWFRVRAEARKLRLKTSVLPEVPRPKYSPVPPEVSSK